MQTHRTRRCSPSCRRALINSGSPLSSRSGAELRSGGRPGLRPPLPCPAGFDMAAPCFLGWDFSTQQVPQPLSSFPSLLPHAALLLLPAGWSLTGRAVLLPGNSALPFPESGTPPLAGCCRARAAVCPPGVLHASACLRKVVGPPLLAVCCCCLSETALANRAAFLCLLSSGPGGQISVGRTVHFNAEGFTIAGNSGIPQFWNCQHNLVSTTLQREMSPMLCMSPNFFNQQVCK